MIIKCKLNTANASSYTHTQVNKKSAPRDSYPFVVPLGVVHCVLLMAYNSSFTVLGLTQPLFELLHWEKKKKATD